MTHTLRLTPLFVLLALGACVTVPPSGPSMTVMPGSGKSFDQFRVDDADCRSFANTQSGGATAAQAAENSEVRSAALGTVVGAIAGAAIGGRGSAGVGAATGLVFGSIAGTGAAQQSARGLQQRYDAAYQQCMYAKGDKVPVSGRFVDSAPQERRNYPPPPPGNYPPPSPPGNYSPSYAPPPPPPPPER